MISDGSDEAGLGEAVGRLAERVARQLEDQVLSGELSPERRALLERSTRTLAATALAAVGGGGVTEDADAADRARAAFAVLASLASARQEEAAAAVRRAVEDAVARAMRVGLAALLASLGA